MSTAVMPTYARYDLVMDRGEGAYIYTTDGRRFLDFATGIAVDCLGHAHPHLVSALQAQAGKLWHCSNLYHIPDQQRLADRLAANSFAEKVFFCNSGLEALEGAIKLARKYQSAVGQPERYRVISMENSFHGRSFATLAASNNPKHVTGFGPMIEAFDLVPFGNTNALRAAIGSETAAILVEPVQGEGGIKPASLDYLRELRRIADEFGLLLVYDEVQCGMGRTGKLFAHEWAAATGDGAAPDVMALAKGLGGGFPIGAFLASDKAAAGMVPGTHGSTFGGNPLASAVGNAVLDVLLEPGFLDGVDKVARKLWHDLVALVGQHPRVFAEVRGAGLMLGLKCEVPAGDFINKLHELGLLTVPAGDNVVRLLPPLIIGESESNEALDILERAAAGWPEG